MALVEFNRNPSSRELLVFGALLAVFAGVLGGFLLWRGANGTLVRSIWIAGGALSALFFAAPPLRRPLYLGWSALTFPIGWTISHAVLLLTFALVVTPVGLLLRLAGRDAMGRRFDPRASSYWTPYPRRDPRHYFRQF